MTKPNKSFSMFMIIWSGQLLSRIGSGISAFALGVYLYQTTGRATSFSSLLLCAFLPSVLFAPVGGIIADRMDRKRMMALGDMGSALGILFIIVMFQLYRTEHWSIYVGVSISSLFGALHSPAFKASVTDLLDDKDYAKASGLIQLAEASRYLLSPVIAAFLITRLSLENVLAMDMLTFLVAALTAVFITKRLHQTSEDRSKESMWNDFTAGIGYIVRKKFIFHLLCLTSMVTFLTGILQSLFIPLLLSLVNASTAGSIQSLTASGILAGSVLIGVSSTSISQNKTLCASLCSAGLFYLLIGISTDTMLITISAFCFFFTLPFVNTSLDVLFRQNIDPELQGRIWSLISLISQTGMIVAFGITGILVDCFFNPLVTKYSIVSHVMGTGPARGTGLMVIVAGFILSLCGLFVTPWSFKTIYRFFKPYHLYKETRVMNHIVLKVLFVVCLITPLTVEAAGPNQNESGFSGRLQAGAFFLQTDSQFSTQSSNSITPTINGPADRHSVSSALAALYLRYQFENGTAVYAGNPLDVTDGFALSAGIIQPMGASTLDVAITWLPMNEEWKNPYQSGIPRATTDVTTYGLCLQWQDIGGSPWTAEYAINSSDIEDDEIGNSYDDLKRGGLEHEFKVNYTLALRPGLTLNPEIGYTYADTEGRSNRYHGLSMGTTVTAMRFPWMFIGLASVHHNHYQTVHPLFIRTRKESGITTFGQVMRLNLFGVKRLFASGGVGYIYTDANINFFDSQTVIGLTSVGINF